MPSAYDVKRAGRLSALFVALSGAMMAALPSNETFDYTIEWRLIEGGRAHIALTPGQIHVKLESVGLVSRLYKVEDNYHVSMPNGFCASGVSLQANEGKRRRETRITFNSQRMKASYHEQDLVKNTTVLQKEIDTPACVHDIMGALFALRSQKVELGHFLDMPISDGKKSVIAKIEAQEREQVKTPAGTFKTIRYEAYLFDGVLYSRKARAFVWITDDDRRLPVQIRIRVNVAVGTINVMLAKETHK